MKREFLEGLGLEKEAIEKIMTEHGKTVESYKTKVTDLQTSNDDLNGQLTQRDKDLKDLKKKAEGSEDLQTQFTELQKKYNTDKTAYEAKIRDTQLTSALKIALNGKVHDADLVAGLIDKSTIELGEDGNVTKGLDEQIKTLQEAKSFLFVPETDPNPTIRGAKPAEGDPGGGEPNDPFAAKLAKYN
ncbi:phage scaffolding protein [Lederbergia wuyishanensis]|uniref:Myosin heavy subunit n=1 Tax=Lederbergia wuyishanensis TaxID=1347903 RepID=A0ABU0D738_9BACI|nr:phage scaffolding protein [Lederbergia wuyishanensis]MCJ8008909.1 phage scaffolding protein [Lederbergia wuyishanensis]MDQ0344234.1 myosin heavy subunit [Lederbergia wuyishanensis]